VFVCTMQLSEPSMLFIGSVVTGHPRPEASKCRPWPRGL